VALHLLAHELVHCIINGMGLPPAEMADHAGHGWLFRHLCQNIFGHPWAEDKLEQRITPAAMPLLAGQADAETGVGWLNNAAGLESVQHAWAALPGAPALQPPPACQPPLAASTQHAFRRSRRVCSLPLIDGIPSGTQSGIQHDQRGQRGQHPQGHRGCPSAVLGRRP
jgi:hypothetical protein